MNEGQEWLPVYRLCGSSNASILRPVEREKESFAPCCGGAAEGGDSLYMATLSLLQWPGVRAMISVDAMICVKLI